MILRLALGAEDTESFGIRTSQQISADGTGCRGANPGDGDVVRQFRAGDFTDNNRLELALGGIVEHDHRVIESRVLLVLSHRLDPFAVSHEPRGFGRRYASLVDADSHSGRNVDSSAQCVQLRVLSPLAESCAHGFDGSFHPDDASDFCGTNEQRFH